MNKLWIFVHTMTQSLNINESESFEVNPPTWRGLDLTSNFSETVLRPTSVRFTPTHCNTSRCSSQMISSKHYLCLQLEVRPTAELGVKKTQVFWDWKPEFYLTRVSKLPGGHLNCGLYVKWFSHGRLTILSRLFLQICEMAGIVWRPLWITRPTLSKKFSHLVEGLNDKNIAIHS